MNKEQLIQEIKYSLPSRRLLDVVSFGGVAINGEIVVLKNRFDTIPDDIIKYNKHYGLEHDLSEIERKNVIFSPDVFGRRGVIAMVKLAEVMMNEKV